MTGSSGPDDARLTPRQREVVELVATGLTNVEIASVLDISPGTVKIHLSSIYRALEVTNRTEAAAMWAAHAGSSAPASLPGATAPRIIVLPLRPLSPDLEDRYVSEGITDDLTTMLSRMAGLWVVGRGTAQRFATAEPDRVDPSPLGVRWIAEGSARSHGGRLRINVALLEAESRTAVWAETFDRPVDHLLRGHDDVIEEVAAKIATQVAIAESARAARLAPDDLGAWGAYHRAVGYYYFRGVTAENTGAALRYVDRSIGADPEFAHAYGLRATTLAGRLALGWTEDPMEDLREIERAGRRALDLAPRDPLVLQHWGYAQSALSNPRDAIPVLEESVQLDPCNPQAHADLGYFLATVGYADAGEARVQRAIELSPLDQRKTSWMSYLAVPSLARGDFDQALAHLEDSIALFDRFPMTLGTAAVLARRMGRPEESERWGRRVREIHPMMSFRAIADWVDEVHAAGQRVSAKASEALDPPSS